jgi:hypothetical protein
LTARLGDARPDTPAREDEAVETAYSLAFAARDNPLAAEIYSPRGAPGSAPETAKDAASAASVPVPTPRPDPAGAANAKAAPVLAALVRSDPVAAPPPPPAGPSQPPAVQPSAVPSPVAASAEPAGEIPCARYVGQPMTGCSVTVARIGADDADVTVRLPEGGARLIRFRAGKPEGSDSRGVFRFTREGDLNMIRIGVAERFEILDSVAFGG